MKQSQVYKRASVNSAVMLSAIVCAWCVWVSANHWSEGIMYKMLSVGFALVSILALVLGRFRLIINDYTVILYADWFVKIPIAKIVNITTTKAGVRAEGGVKPKKIWFNKFSNEALFVQLNTGKKYHIIIENAEQIKEEIEKRMLTLKANR